MSIKIDVQKFVDVNIVHSETIESISTRDTYVICTDRVNETTLFTTKPTNAVAIYGEYLGAKINMFFDNAGRKLLLVPFDIHVDSEKVSNASTETLDLPATETTTISEVSGVSLTKTSENVASLVCVNTTKSYVAGSTSVSVTTDNYTQTIDCGAIAEFINGLDTKYIVVGIEFEDEIIVPEYYFFVSEIVSGILDTNTGIHRKIVVAQTPTVYTNDGNNSLAVKVSTLYGAESTISAYLTKVDVYDSTKIDDYAYTAEIGDFANDKAEITDSDVGDNIAPLKFNFDMKIAGSYRNVGGNLSTGEIGIVNEFILDVLQQTLTEKLLAILSTKIKGQSGVGEIKSAMTEELERYRLSGYLTTDSIWERDDLVINGNVVIKKNTPINLGYYIYVFPFASTKNRRNVTTYVILSTEKGIRNIVVNGLAL